MTISKKIAPMDQMSTGNEYKAEPMSTSGERYHSVTASWEYFFTGIYSTRAKPKSPSLIIMAMSSHGLGLCVVTLYSNTSGDDDDCVDYFTFC